MTSAELDRWSVGVIGGVYRVLDQGDPISGRREYPTSAAGFVWIATRRIRRRALACSPEALELAEHWLKAVGGMPRAKAKRREHGKS
jgi:hypothetical protein